MLKIWILLAIIILPISLFSQQLRTSVDWAIFDYDAENVFLEVYFSFLQSDLFFAEQDNQLKATTLGQLFLSSEEEIVKEFAWKTETVIQDSSEQSLNRPIVDRVSFVVPYGSFACKFVLQDLTKTCNKDSVTFNLHIPKSNKVHLSEIELASSITQAGEDKSSPFYKNSLIIEPNPSLVYSFEKPALFFYLEAYNLPDLQLSQGYYLKYYIRDENGAPHSDISEKIVKKKNVVSPSVEFGMINVGKLKTGTYLFAVEVLSLENEKLLEKSKKFYVLQQEDLQRTTQAIVGQKFEDSIFAQMDSSDLELEFMMVFYLLKKQEHPVHKGIQNIEGKRKFLFSFWQNRFPDQNVNDNPFRNEYYRRYNRANEEYKAYRWEGWKTDRGRVFMVYGSPDDIERYPNEPDKYPYEIWHYYSLQNGVIFVFADLEGHRNYRLLHSNLLGEINDLNYVNTIRKGF